MYLRTVDKKMQYGETGHILCVLSIVYAKQLQEFFKFHSLNYRLESLTNKNRFHMCSLSNNFIYLVSRKSFSLSIFGQREMWNGGWLHLDNHLEKLLEAIFSSKFIFLTIRMDIESLLELLLDVRRRCFWHCWQSLA